MCGRPANRSLGNRSMDRSISMNAHQQYNKQPVRAHHCRVCGLCVSRFDHHCGWLNQVRTSNDLTLIQVSIYLISNHIIQQCVGEENYRYFLGFVAVRVCRPCVSHLLYRLLIHTPTARLSRLTPPSPPSRYSCTSLPSSTGPRASSSSLEKRCRTRSCWAPRS